MPEEKDQSSTTFLPAETNWTEKFLCCALLKNARVACSPKILLLVIAALLASTAGWRVLGLMFSGSDDTKLVTTDGDKNIEFDQGTLVSTFGGWPWTSSSRSISEFSPRTSRTQPSWYESIIGTVATSRAGRQLECFVGLILGKFSFVSSAFLLLCFVWGLLVWAVAGGAISRIVAMRLTRDESVSLFDSITHAKQTWLSYVLAPLIPLLAILVIAALMAFFALFARIPVVGPFVFAAAKPLWLVPGLIMSILFLGVAFSWPLMWSAVGTECCDSFDALGRAYGYLFAKPLKYLFYIIVSLIIGWLAWFVVSAFANLTVEFTNNVSAWGTSREIMDQLKSEHTDVKVSGNIMNFWDGWVLIIPIAYGYSYFWAAAGNIYLLLRHEEDGTELDEVYMNDEQYSYGLPPVEPASSEPATTETAPTTDEENNSSAGDSQ